MLNLEDPSYSVPTRASATIFDACIKFEQKSKAGSHCSDGDFPSQLCLTTLSVTLFLLTLTG